MKYTEHNKASVAGFDVVDATGPKISSFGLDRLIWVGIYGEGRWMTAAQAKELAAAILQVTAAHEQRLGVAA